MPIETTVVGSFPPTPGKPLEEAIREVVDLQLHHGVDVISDGELRCSMIQYFDQISGLERLGDGLRIAGKIEPLKPEKIDEFYKLKDYKTVKSILKSMGKEDTRVKISFTGPMTLGTTCASADINSTIEHYNLDDEETLFSDFSRALLPIVERALELGAYVQIDEPLLSTGQISLDTAKKILKNFTSQLPADAVKEEKIFCHVCGSIASVSNLYDVLLGLGFPVLSMGFSGELEKENFVVVSKASLEKSGVKLAAGFISNSIVEDESIVVGRCGRIVEKVGRENIRYLCPDCGFRVTAPKKVRLILEQMAKVAEKVSNC